MARSGITISNQERLRRYNAERMQEERNDVIQQAELYGQLAEENQLDAQAASLARLAKNVFKRSFDNVSPELKTQVAKVSTTLLSSIKAGKLDQLVKSLVAIPDNLLNPRQKVIKGDLKNPEFKRLLNEAIAEEVAKRSTNEQIEQVIKEMVAGSEGVADLEEMVSKSRSGSVDSSSSIDSNATTATLGTTVSLDTSFKGPRKKIKYHELESELFKKKKIELDSMAREFGFKLDPTIENKSSIKKHFRALAYREGLITDIPEASQRTLIKNADELYPK